MSWVTSTSVRPARALGAEHVHALLRERRVADREHLVDEHDVGVGLDHHREREPHHHPRRVVLQLEVGELAQLGEVEHRVEPPPRLAPAEPHHHAVEHDVLARGQLRVEADAELDERRQPSRDPDAPGVGAVDARHDLQQRALARAVAPDDAEELALVHVERDPPQRLQLAVAAARERVQRALLERVDPVLRDAEGLVEPAGLDDDRRSAAHRAGSVRGAQTRARQRRSRFCSKLARSGRLASPSPAGRRATRAAPPDDPAHQLALAAERLVAAGERAQRARGEPRNAGGERSAATKRSSARRLRRREPGAAADEQHLGLHLARQVAAEVRAAAAAQRRARAAARSPVGDLAEERAAVLDVVVERAVDVGDVAGRERDEAEPVVVELQPRRVGERQRELGDLAPEQRAAPVIVLATSSETRSVWLLRRPCHSVSRSTRPCASTSRWSE